VNWDHTRSQAPDQLHTLLEGSSLADDGEVRRLEHRAPAGPNDWKSGEQKESDPSLSHCAPGRTVEGQNRTGASS
jgi:hypothetical protein